MERCPERKEGKKGRKGNSKVVSPAVSQCEIDVGCGLWSPCFVAGRRAKGELGWSRKSIPYALRNFCNRKPVQRSVCRVAEGETRNEVSGESSRKQDFSLLMACQLPKSRSAADCVYPSRYPCCTSPQQATRGRSTAPLPRLILLVLAARGERHEPR